MQITILYFARIKEVVNVMQEQVQLPEGVSTVHAVKQWLAQRGEQWAGVFHGKAIVRAAINHALVDESAALEEGDELAFFPPVTGG